MLECALAPASPVTASPVTVCPVTVCGAVGFDASLTASEWVDEGRYSLDADSKYAGAPSKGRAAKQNKVCASHMLAT